MRWLKTKLCLKIGKITSWTQEARILHEVFCYPESDSQGKTYSFPEPIEAENFITSIPLGGDEVTEKAE